MEYLLHILVLICIYSVLATSLDLLAGHTGLLSMAQGAFYGLGAYSSALLAVRLGMSFVPSTLVGVAVGALLSLFVSIPSLRLHGDYFVIATFSFQMIIFGVFNNWMDLTRGPLGIPGIPRPVIFGWEIRSEAGFFILAFAFAAFSYGIVGRLTKSPFGRVLRAIREDEILVQSLGKNTRHFKIIAFAVSAALAAGAGSFYAHYVTFIDPTSFTAMESILIISMVIIGGASSTKGSLIGATLLVTLPEALRFLGLSPSVAANLRQIAYGVLLIFMTMVRPKGFAGHYGFER